MHDDRLGEALRRQLRGLVDDISPSPTLLEQLRRYGSSTKAQGRKRRARLRRRRIIASALVGLTVLVAVAFELVSGSNPSEAFAVTAEPDGSVQVTLSELTGVAGANARLAQLGVRAKVLPITAACTAHVSVSYFGIDETPTPTIKLVPNEIAAGTTTILAAKTAGSNHVEIAIGNVAGRPPSCVSASAIVPGPPGESSSSVPDSHSRR